MSLAINHIIHKINLEIDAPTKESGEDIQKNIRSFLEDNLFPLLEQIIDEYQINNKFLTFNKIDINITDDKIDSLNKNLSEILSERLKHIISKGIEHIDIKENGINTEISDHESRFLSQDEKLEDVQTAGSKDIEHKIIDIFFYYIKEGMLPWSASLKYNWLEEKKLVKVLEENKSLIPERFFQKDFIRSTWYERLILQFSEKFILSFIRFIVPLKLFITIQNKIKEILNLQKPNKTLLLKRILFILKQVADEKIHRNEYFFSDTDENKILELLKNDMISDFRKEKKPEIKAKQKSTSEQNKKLKDKSLYETDKKIEKKTESGIFLANAGLAILHPFFEYLFKDFHLLTDGQFTGAKERTIAIHLLYYLAEKKEKPYDYQLLFEKYLCGMKTEEPVSRFIKLTPKMKDESEVMLNACINHWKVLKKTTPDGLREGFLQRQGKLIIGENHRLIIEKRSMDILLDQLPWSISMIKLPWMKTILHLEWN